MDARLAKVRNRKLKKLKEQGLASTTDVEDGSIPGEVIPEEDERIKGEQETSSSKDENDVLIDDNEDRIKNKIARMENSHSNKWEKNKISMFPNYYTLSFTFRLLFYSAERDAFGQIIYD